MEPRINLFETPTGAKVAKRFYNTALALDGSTLPKAVRHLVELRVSQINGCGLCVDMHSKDAAADGETAVRLALVAAWRETTVYTAAERAALALAEEATRLADLHGGVSDETWAAVREHYDDDEVATLLCVVSMVNAANRMNVVARVQGGSYEPGMLASLDL
ncbi:carboxymuconolactone decarboxylase family protein [Asanoa sp. NPDC050611]|uniref:carboxymuconolactone decarboxylase family protein n=1 Tax=Asanoa sp. NPDC050611 TaxID=3157098 RepID=UPI0033C6AA06